MESLIETFGAKMFNPLQLLGVINDLSFDFTPFQKQVTKNCKDLRNQVRKYVIARKSGEATSKLQGQSDILTLLLQSPDIFGDEDVVDEVIDFFMAGSMTIQSVTQMMVCHFATDPNSLAKARGEFNAHVQEELKATGL